MDSEINPGVRRLVALLRDHGFNTVDSGDGVTNVAAGMELALDYPHVFIVVDPALAVAESVRCARVLADSGVRFEHQEPSHGNSMTDVVESNGALPSVVARYSPLDGIATIEVTHVLDSHLTEVE